MNRLKDTTCYLCGPMDRVPDGGVEWRENISKDLKDMGIGVFNPCDKPSDFAPEDKNTREEIDKAKAIHDYERVAEVMKPICSVDLRMVDVAHFLIMNLDLDTHLCGSYHEAFVAIAQKKPILIFSNWFQILDYLHMINSSEDVDHLDRWRFFDFEKVFSG